MHALGVIDLAGTTVVEGKNTNCLVEGGCHELTAGRCEIDVKHSRHVVFVDHLGLIQATHVEGVAVSILVALKEI